MVSTGRRDSYRGPDLKLFVRDVREGKKRPIAVRSWSTIKDVKEKIQQITHVPPHAIRLYFGPLLTSGRELPNHRTLHDVGIYRSGETLLLDIKNVGSNSSSSAFSSLRNSNDVCISSSMVESTPKNLRALVSLARRGLSLGLKPDLVLEGSGGTYFMHDVRKKRIAVFKPADEEPYAENNPRGYLRQPGQPMSLREGIVPGEACMREVAAYMLDTDGFAGVPMTTLVEARHPTFHTNGARLNCSQGGAAMGSHSITPNSLVDSSLMKKPGSFQEFINCDCTMDDISPSKISVEEVHKIAILDIRIMNADRNAANLLVRRKPDNKVELVPIDHGYCLRSVCDVSWMDWCWLDWPQLKQPISDKHQKYIQNLDIEADARMLRERLNICEEAVDYFRASSALLKAGVAAGLTLYDIAVLCCRNDNLAEEPSMMEKLFDMASELAHRAVESNRWHHTAASRALVEQLCPQRRRSSMLSLDSRRSFHRSVSNAEICSNSSPQGSDRSLLLEADDSPGMAQSSGSDSSSNNGDAADETEECEEWAASLIADLTEHQQLTPIKSPMRSESVSSDDCSNDSDRSSPKGFWRTAPGSVKAPNLEDDEDSIDWSPGSSPPDSVDMFYMMDDPPKLVDGPPAGKENKPGLKTPTVTFAALTETFSHATTIDDSNNDDADYKTPPTLDERGRFASSDSGGMTRSKSYTALSATPGRAKKREASSLRAYPSVLSQDYDNYRKYFQKFIDLVIVRETTAALHHSRHGAEHEVY